MAWRKTSKNIWQNPTFPRTSIVKHPAGGYMIYTRGNARGPFKTLAEAKKKGEPWIRQFMPAKLKKK